MARKSKAAREVYKEMIRRILIRNPDVTIWKCMEILRSDKRNPVTLGKNYICEMLRELRDEMAVNIHKESVNKMLVEYKMRRDETMKKYWEIVDKPPIITHVVTIPDLDKDPTGQNGTVKRVIELEKTTAKDKMEALAKIQSADKEYMNAMIIIGNVPGSEEVDMKQLNPNMNIAIQNNFISEKELNLKEKEKLKELEKLEKQIEKLDSKKDEKIIEAEIIQN